jgi:general stress protein YciG
MSMADKSSDSGMTVKEAGQRGGKENAKRHDHKHFQSIGKMGGEARARNRDRDQSQDK